MLIARSAIYDGTIFSKLQSKDYAPVAQLDRVLVSETKGHRFESCRARQLLKPPKEVVLVIEVILSVMPNKKKLSMEIREVEVSKEPLELYKILKFEGMVSSGGEAKSVISEGQVLVNGKVETRKRKQIVSGDIIEFGEEKIRIQLK